MKTLPGILKEQGGELLRLKVVGGYVPVNADGAIEAVHRFVLA